MAPWQKLADDLKTDPALKNLDEKQVGAVIDILTLVIYADKQVSFMEETELEHMLIELPWMDDKEEKVDILIKKSAKEANEITDESGCLEMIDRAASVLTGPEVRLKVYEMASTLARADMDLHEKEKQILSWLEDRFEIPEDSRIVSE